MHILEKWDLSLLRWFYSGLFINCILRQEMAVLNKPLSTPCSTKQSTLRRLLSSICNCVKGSFVVAIFAFCILIQIVDIEIFVICLFSNCHCHYLICCARFIASVYYLYKLPFDSFAVGHFLQMVCSSHVGDAHKTVLLFKRRHFTVSKPWSILLLRTVGK